MKKHNKFLIFLTAFMLIFNFATFKTSAEESIDYISVETFQSMMDELYSRYDSSFVILDDNDVKYISLEYAEKLYQNASKGLEEMTVKQTAQAEAVYKYNILDSHRSSVVSRAAMSIYYYDSDTFTVSSSTVPFAYANFKVHLNGSLNAQYNSFITLDYSGIYQNGLSCNYDGFDIVSESTYYSKNNTRYSIYANMDVHFSWTDPIVGIKFGETMRYVYAKSFDSVDGIL